MNTPKSGRTRTVPDGLRVGAPEDPRIVTGLNLLGTNTLYQLGSKRPVIIGSEPGSERGHDTIVIPSPYVSARHCKLDWRKIWGLCVTDLSSKNGTYSGDERIGKGFRLRPGRTFVVGALIHRLVALNDDMLASFPELIDILGPDEHAGRRQMPPSSPGEIIVAAANGDHLLITSQPHCEQTRLAHIVHALSKYHARQPVELAEVPVDSTQQLDLLRSAAGTTLVLDLGANDLRLPVEFVQLAFSSKYRIRIIVLADSVAVAHEALGPHAVQIQQHVSLLPIASRPTSIGRLLDRAFFACESPLRLSHLTPANQEALRAYHWPDNFASVKKVATLLAAIQKTAVDQRTSINKAAHELGIPPTTLYDWYKLEMHLSRPLVSGGVGERHADQEDQAP